MKVSFCTTCMNRAHHLKVTLPRNLSHTVDLSKPDKFEFVVLDYSSKDDLNEWITTSQELRPYFEAGVLVYARYNGAKHFRHSHAKNMAHRIASGDYLVNLDADNFTSIGFGTFLQKSFQERPNAIICTNISDNRLNVPPYIGCMGRIALSRKAFYQIGGYDESEKYKGWSGEDSDLIVRALKHGYLPKIIRNRDYLHVIQHGNEERVAYTDAADKSQELLKIAQLGGFGILDLFHKAAFIAGVALRPYVANTDRLFGSGEVKILNAARLAANYDSVLMPLDA